MKKFDLIPTEDIIKEIIINGEVNRHNEIRSLLKKISLCDDNTVIAVDGSWGTGKTFFIRELKYVIENIEEYEMSFNSETSYNNNKEKYFDVRKVKDNIMLYYNAWENDIHQDPLDSLLYNLLNEFPKYKDKLVDYSKFKELLKSLGKDISKNLLKIDIDNILNVMGNYNDYDSLSRNITTIEEKKEAINDLINSALKDNNRIIIIVDELDRCNPEFAVRLLETLKHFYNNPKITFILAVNNEQLSNTIKRFYGNNFDGFRYLSKFYDIAINLSRLDTKKYLKFIFNNSNGENENPIEKQYNKNFGGQNDWYFTNNISMNLIDYYDFSLREINKFVTIYDLIMPLIRYGQPQHAKENDISNTIIIPILVTLKIVNIEKYNSFINGHGLPIIREIYNNIINKSEYFSVFKTDLGIDSNDEGYINEINKVYEYFISSGYLSQVISMTGY